MPRCLVALTALLIALTCVPSIAAARSVVVLVADRPADEATLSTARFAAIEVMAERSVRLVRTPDGPVCEAPECAREIAAQTGASFVALIDVVFDDGAWLIQITAVPAQGAIEERREAIGDAGVAGASAAALTRLLEETTVGAHGFLLVESDPPGADVHLDGVASGHTPLRLMTTPGEHQVRVQNGTSHRRSFTVEVVADEESAVRADFGGGGENDEGDGADDDSPSGPAQTHSEPSPFNWLIGGGLALGGIIALISPLQTIAQNGQCVQEIENVGCVERVAIGAQSAVLLGVGAAALIAAVVVDATAPIRVDVSGGTDGENAGVMVHVRGVF